jgi:hypothetical protein
MSVTKRVLPRRTFLRGAAAVIGLPLLDAMVPAFASDAPPIKRLGFVYLPNGVSMNFTGINYWRPQGEGRMKALSPILAPLEAYRDRVTVVSGLAQRIAEASAADAGGDHTKATASWLTGVRAKRTEGADVSVGMSADQIAANAIGRQSVLPSLELSIDLSVLQGMCDSAYSCVYLNTLSWASRSAPLPTENNPRLVFERLFGDGGTNEQRARRAREDRSILDYVNADFARLSRSLSASDRTHVDDYLTSVREVERRIQTVEKLGDSADLPALDRPRGIPETFGEHVKLMYELQWLAFQADLTRVVTFMLGRELNFRAYPEIGIAQGHHTLSHHQDRPETMERYAKLNTYQTQLLADFVAKLATTREGNGTLLDHSLFLYGASLSNPNLHAHFELPLALIGGPAGRAGGGYHVVEKSSTPMTNLLLTMLDTADVPVEALGDSTGRVRLPAVANV